jgi:hypothetical protein
VLDDVVPALVEELVLDMLVVVEPPPLVVEAVEPPAPLEVDAVPAPLPCDEAPVLAPPLLQAAAARTSTNAMAA